MVIHYFGYALDVSEYGELTPVTSGLELRVYLYRKKHRRFVYFSERGKKSRHCAPYARLLAMAFVPNPHNLPQVDHIDGNSENDTIANLRWVSRKDNINNPNSKPKMIAGIKKAWSDPEMHARASASAVKRWSNPETRRAASTWWTDERRLQAAALMSQRREDPVARAKWQKTMSSDEYREKKRKETTERWRKIKEHGGKCL
jgi:hypothetical protein